MSAIDGKIIFKNNGCYKANYRIKPKGIVVHSTGANNPTLRRYIAPDDGVIGKNQYGNDWNRGGVDKCVHAFIGKDKNGEVKTYKTLPFSRACWGCGGGSKGSYNYNPPYIQFEMCEDDHSDKDYCKKVYNKAVSLCAKLCKQYNIDPNNIVSHKEANAKGYASPHGDPDNWWSKFGYNMNGFRKAVKAKLAEVKVKTKKDCNLYCKAYKDPVGDTVAYRKVKKGTTLVWLNDKKNGWSKVKYEGNTYYAMNGNLNKSNLSKCPKKILAKNCKANEVKSGKLATTLKKGKTVKVICKIESGKYKGYSYIKKGTKHYYVKFS